MTRRGEVRQRETGFSLVEVMIALAILGLGLTILIRSIAATAAQGPEVQMMGVSTNLARGKMLDIEEQLMKDGFLETEQSTEGDFSDEGWPKIKWSAKIEIVELPSLDTVMALQEAAAAQAEAAADADSEALEAAAAQAGVGSGAGIGTGTPEQTFGNSALSGMLSMFGGFGGGGGEDDSAFTSGVSLIYPKLQEVFKASLRKVTLSLSYEVVGRARSFDTVAFYTDPAGMTKAMGSAGVGAPDSGSKAGSASGGKVPSKGSGTVKGNTK